MAVDGKFYFQRRRVLCGLIHLVGYVTVGSAENGFHSRSIETVFKVVDLKLVGSRNRYGAYLVKS